MKTVDFSVFATNYWKPEDDKDYVVVLSNPRTEEREFKDKGKKWQLIHDVLSVNGDPLPKPQEFSTGSRSFIEGIKPIIEAAAREGREKYTVILRRKNGKEYTLADYDLVRKVAGGQ